MSYLEFIASLLGSLAWPLVVLVVVLLLREQIKNLATRIVERAAEMTELSAPGVNFKFAANTEKIRREIDEVAAKGSGEGTLGVEVVVVPGGDDDLSDASADALRDNDAGITREPLAIVLDSYQRLELAAREALARCAPSKLRPNMPPGLILKALRDAGAVGMNEIAPIAEDLRMTRNQAVHKNPFVTAQDAQRFAEAADWVTARLSSLSRS